MHAIRVLIDIDVIITSLIDVTSSSFLFYKCNKRFSTKLKVFMNSDCLSVHAPIFINIFGLLRLNINYLILKMMSASLIVNSQGHRKKSYYIKAYWSKGIR